MFNHKFKYYCALILLSALIESCHSNDNGTLNEAIEIESESQGSDLNRVEKTSSLNQTNFKTELLLHANGGVFYDPNGQFYYNVGDYKIAMVSDDVTYFRLRDWDLQVMNDTVYFERSIDELTNAGVPPIATINFRYPRKYGVNCFYFSEQFGQISVCRNDEFTYSEKSTIFELVTNNSDTLRIVDLDNVDVFESKQNSCLYILSYRADLLPDLRIIRVQ